MSINIPRIIDDHCIVNARSVSSFGVHKTFAISLDDEKKERIPMFVSYCGFGEWCLAATESLCRRKRSETQKGGAKP